MKIREIALILVMNLFYISYSEDKLNIMLWVDEKWNRKIINKRERNGIHINRREIIYKKKHVIWIDRNKRKKSRIFFLLFR